MSWSRVDRERAILHFNVADFAVAVERAQDSGLRSRPLIVACGSGGRSQVYDMSEEAYGEGVRKGMVLRRAMKLCRGATLLPPRPEKYRLAMNRFFRELRGYSPLIESGREDGHFFVDVTGTHRLHGPPPDVGWRIRREVQGRLGINPIWTLGGSRLVAKVASRLVKPVGEYIVTPGEEEGFLAPLSLSLLPGLTVVERDRLQEFQVETIGCLAGFSISQLAVPFGKRASHIHAISRGVDDREIGHSGHGQSIELEHHFGRDTNDRREVEAVVAQLASRVGVLLRQDKQEGGRLELWLSYSDGVCMVRQATSRRATDTDCRLCSLALTALDRALRRRVRIRSCRLVCDRLRPRSPQLLLFPEPEQELRVGQLQNAMDHLQSRFCTGVIQRGRGCDQGLTLDVSPAAWH